MEKNHAYNNEFGKTHGQIETIQNVFTLYFIHSVLLENNLNYKITIITCIKSHVQSGGASRNNAD